MWNNVLLQEAVDGVGASVPDRVWKKLAFGVQKVGHPALNNLIHDLWYAEDDNLS